MKSESKSGERFTLKKRVGVVLRLTRFPALATAIADPWAGYALGSGRWSGDSWETWAFLALIGVAFYAAGMVTNDLADRKRDGLSRKDRPLPSGEIGIGGAWFLVILLLLLGFLGCAFLGDRAIVCGAVLVGTIFLHNFVTKTHLVFGLITMGTCRMLNIGLGMIVSEGGVLLEPILALGGYVLAICLIAELEDRPYNPRWLYGAMVLSGVSVGWILCSASNFWVVIPILCLGLSLLPSLFGALRVEARGEGIGKVVGHAIRGIILVDSALVLGGGQWEAALLIGVLWPVAWGLRWIAPVS
ncbi:MAG: UbiA family prenyltransferase [Planctomycetota bacterium]|nr:UbiA family prenyltransferase [Planctomycetota bacterium]